MEESSQTQTSRGTRWRWLLTRPTVWGPIVVGGLAWWFSSGPLGLGLAATAVGCGVARLAWGLTFGAAQVEAQSAAERQAEETREHLEQLRNLRRDLRQDKDPRTDQCVRDLREMYRRIQGQQLLASDDGPVGLREVKQQTRQLYDACLAALQRSIQLWRDAGDMTTAEKREEMLTARDALVNEASAGVMNLGRALDQLQAARSRPAGDADDLAELRSELDQGLEVARNVQQRLDELDRQLRLPQ